MNRTVPTLSIPPVGPETGSNYGGRKQLSITASKSISVPSGACFRPNGMMTKARCVDDIAFLCAWSTPARHSSLAATASNSNWRKPGEVFLLDFHFGDCRADCKKLRNSID